MKDSSIAWAALFGFLGVALGAFGAHALQGTLTANDRLATWDTAVLYQFVHVGLLLVLGLLGRNAAEPGLLRASRFFAITGILIFSGSLYLLSITNIRWLGAITPIGGIGFLVAWACLFIHALKNQESK
ncbi:MAG: DUF423 domain-containing protein [Bacteroidia bacterium]